MPKRQRAEDQISPAQRRKLFELWDTGYELVDLCQRFGIGEDTGQSIVAEENARRRGAARVRQTIAESYRAWLRDEVIRQIG
ncbi:hypothetical protein FHT72_004555 [Rhizobium sp. BK077]|uniref:hypothetical protein n=1 Tax=unclassified Rhizobium TaxID=2613769 RepID=UPI00161C8DB9|nr:MULTISPECIES: hypothetical protein [unclassified Rhizobium]MBB3300903.1 hypothetical protein [Rhizobium sp. BK112]MBB3370047.1 hypothetical protein [Rhizobium sp. BK077]MBB4180793.1 hypothetical protein [Rhizobium sp. BK109]